MGNDAASEDTPTGREPATDTADELAGRSVDREVARTLAAFRELAIATTGSRDVAPADQAALAALERKLGAVFHEIARDREALAPRVGRLEARDAQTHRELVAISGRFRLVHVGALVCAAAIAGAGVLAGPAGFTAAIGVAGLIAGAVARDVARRR